ncbi:tumor protein p53-inducible nuclear protein 2 isoform X1 [Cylas formicarius]|uniref:tumor protein p53-inducible nuclear protein 2 isoform X1 n=1 Tax=Cylas formicarius TaxID=197179 RepID=UPI002958D04A|nr:tumor protein p53-inducible nuclear protein 2 isoform X1 [Cylas formicarius]XP_060519467.1 tumor protein p53-inducible nuclear protein 2 isoform X1 [Cylas formicarius]
MIQILANYLLRNSSTSTSEGVDNNSSEGGNSSSSRVALRTTEHDDGWTLVDRDSEGNSDVSSSEEEDEATNEPRKKTGVTRASSVESLRGTGGMEESWFVTPPPSFTSAGPIHMETSPLENLLIEHPSMSVYQHTGGRRPPFRHNRPSTPSEMAATDMEDNLEEEIVGEEHGDAIVMIRRIPPPRCNRLQALHLHEAQFAKSRRAQKMQIKKSSQSTSRGYLNRTNKAREANGRSWKPRRKERSQGSARSNANNNRKC